MKIFSKIAICTLAATILVTQAQAIELVKVESVTKLTITEAAKESLAQSMKLPMIEAVTVKNIVNDKKSKVNYLSLNKNETLAKTNVTAE